MVVALGACSSETAQRGPDATTSASTTSAATTTTAIASSPVTGTSSPTTGVPGGCPSGIGVAAQSAQQAARCLFQAWEGNDRTRAAAFASLDVVDLLFRERWSTPAGTFKDCSADAATGGQTCTFEHHGNRYLFDVRRSEGGWRVTQLQRSGGGA